MAAVLVQIIEDDEGDIVLLPPGFELDAEQVEIEPRDGVIVLRPAPRLLTHGPSAD